MTLHSLPSSLEVVGLIRRLAVVDIQQELDRILADTTAASVELEALLSALNRR